MEGRRVYCHMAWGEKKMEECGSCKEEHIPGYSFCQCYGRDKHHFLIKRQDVTIDDIKKGVDLV